MAEAAEHEQITIYSAANESISEYIRRSWKYRSLIQVLVYRDIKILYSQTILGITWLVFQPLIAVVIYSLFFNNMLQIETGNIPYPLFVIPGIMGWFHFTKILSEGGMALQQNQDLIRRMEFPKMILLIAKCFYSMHQLLVTLVLLLIVMMCFGYMPGWKIITLPVFIILNTVVAFLVAIWISSMSIRYRDLQQAIPYIISFGIWLTPVFYPVTLLPDNLAFLSYLNPIASVIAGYRWALLGDVLPDWRYLLGWVPVIIALYFGMRYFTVIEKEIGDYV